MTLLSDFADGIKRLQKLNKDLTDLEFQEQILKMRELLIAARNEIIKITEERDAAITALNKDRLLVTELRSRVTVEGYQYDADENGQPKGLPYCPVCAENGKPNFKIFSPNRQWTKRQCPNCRTIFGSAAKQY